MSWSTDMGRPATIFFNEDFDVPGHAREPVPEPMVEAFTPEDVALSRQAGWEEGFAAGRDAARVEHRAGISENLNMLLEEIRGARADLLAQGERMAEDLASLLLAALGKILPDLCARHGAAEIAAVAAEILPPLIREPQIRVQVAEPRIEQLRIILADLDEDLAKKISVTVSSNLGPSDIVVRWHLGEAIRDAEAQWRNILTILAPHGLQPARMTSAPLQRNSEFVG